MKFVSIRLKNFMRYKGENTIEFSTDPDNNVTVVLGDNTVGKTTLAQAFRWCLYGELTNTQYEKSRDVTLLNQDILADMTANDRADVEVELTILNDSDSIIKSGTYRIIRKTTYRRLNPKMVAQPLTQMLRMYVPDPETGRTEPYDNVGKNAGKVDELIGELLPQSLSPYFLFDGERWNDSRQQNINIRDSIYNLVGVNALRHMKEHLNEIGSNGSAAVIQKFESRKNGSGAEYDRVKNEKDKYIGFIGNEENEIKDLKDNYEHNREQVEAIKAILDSNKKVEDDQKEYKRLEKEIENCNSRMIGYYGDIVKKFSDAHMFFASELLEEALHLLEGINLDGSDVPGIIDKTIDYILAHHKCICGNDVMEGSHEEKLLKELRDVVPPALIGGEVGRFKDTLSSWNGRSVDMFNDIKESADTYQDEEDHKEDCDVAKNELEKRIDRKMNFQGEREKLNRYTNLMNQEMHNLTLAEANINQYKINIASCDERLKSLEAQNENNRILSRCQDYAMVLYIYAQNMYAEHTRNLLTELNEIIAKNFKDMFNEQEKILRLDDDYKLRMYYKKIMAENGSTALMEATTLSEGEKIARNFAFIVSILEYANNKKKMEEDVSMLPLVLDGPFSKLSSVNTAKVASVMPQVAEQIIIFMLDKDWKASGLEAHTDPRFMYRILKKIDENSSTIQHEEV